MSKINNPHRDHRQRMKARVRAHGFSALAPHEQIEFLLYYAIPQGDVNPLAHRLTERFGSLSGICRASREELMAVKGIGEHTALLLSVLPQLVRAYLEDSASPVEQYNDIAKLGDLLTRHYIGASAESVCLLLFSGRMKLLVMETVAEGGINAVPLLPRLIVERALAVRAAFAVLAHNHPDGMAIPSADDIAATGQLAAALNLTGVPLLEHIVVAGDQYWPIMMRENLGGRMASVSSLDPGTFYLGQPMPALYQSHLSEDPS